MSGYRDDARELADKINEDIEGVIAKYYPQAIRVQERGKWVMLLTPRVKTHVGTPTPGKKRSASKRPTSSFKVHLDGADRGKWFRFSADVGGWGMQLLHYAVHNKLANDKADWAEAYRLAREHLGIVQEREATHEEIEERQQRRRVEDAQRESRRLADAAAATERKGRRTLNAQEVWSETKLLQGTHGEAYLRERGIRPVEQWPWDPRQSLRFHPSLDYELDRTAGRFPAIVARVQDCFGDTIAVWQIYLDPRAPRKAAIENPKVGRGPAAGGAVRLGGDAAEIGGAEGVESALGAYDLEDFRMPVWAFLSTSGMMAFEPPMFVKRLHIWSDSDLGGFDKGTRRIFDPPGIVAATTLRDRLRPTGIATSIQDGCVHGDALDLLNTKRKYEKQSEPS